MKNKLVLSIFIILLLAAVIPFKFTTTQGLYLFGWLPVVLAYWWTLMIVNLVFILWVAKMFISIEDETEKEA